MQHKLLIGNKNYSSWSLRPWILMRVKNIPFSELKVYLYRDDTTAQIKKYSPTGKVPYLENESVQVWDSLAICEYLADCYPEKHCWPIELNQRANARAICAEMHSGFSQIRDKLPMNCRMDKQYTNISHELQSEINRVDSLWQDCLNKHSDPFLYAGFTIADAMFAPVVLRFNSYQIPVSQRSKEYMQQILNLPAIQEWVIEGRAETEIIQQAEIE